MGMMLSFLRGHLLCCLNFQNTAGKRERQSSVFKERTRTNSKLAPCESRIGRASGYGGKRIISTNPAEARISPARSGNRKPIGPAQGCCHTCFPRGREEGKEWRLQLQGVLPCAGLLPPVPSERAAQREKRLERPRTPARQLQRRAARWEWNRRWRAGALERDM